MSTIIIITEPQHRGMFSHRGIAEYTSRNKSSTVETLSRIHQSIAFIGYSSSGKQDIQQLQIRRERCWHLQQAAASGHLRISPQATAVRHVSAPMPVADVQSGGLDQSLKCAGSRPLPLRPYGAAWPASSRATLATQCGGCRAQAHA